MVTLIFQIFLRFHDNAVWPSLSSEVTLEVEKLLNITSLPHMHKQTTPKECKS